MRLRSFLAIAAMASACGPDDGPPTEPEPDPGPLRWVELSDSGRYWCARTSAGHVRCWGELDAFQNTVPEAPFEPEDGIVAIGAGSALCGVVADGRLRCFAGSGDAMVLPTDETDVATVSLSNGRGCIRRRDGTARCWESSSDSAVFEVPDERFSKVAVGVNHAAGLTEDGRFLDWGDRQFPGAFDRQGPYQEISVGNNALCAWPTATGRVVCTGAYQRFVPDEPVSRLFPVIGGSHGLCIEIEASGEVVCWSSDPRWTEFIRQVPPGVSFLTIVPSSRSACGITTDHEIVCWGEDTGVGRLSPPPLPGD